MKLYNSISKTVESFNPIAPPNVSMYVCGVTVYDDCHMGHARAYVAFDLLKRVLIHEGYTVTHVQNFTDIDDKIIARANELNETTESLTQRYIDSYFSDMKALNIIPANNYPKATDSIPQMIALIQSLIEKEAAYVVNQSVYFRINACTNYGELSHKDVDDLQSGHRIAVEDQKESALDFILWKPSKDGEPSWQSPWGLGRPGWHTECVAMVHEQLGDHIDIHGGGADLKFPHHENELAQAKCAYHTPFANYWIHNGFVTINDEKMSKSTGNFFLLRDVLAAYDPSIVRYFLLRTHYRSPLNYSIETLDDAKKAYQKLTSIFDIVPEADIPLSLQAQFNQKKEAFWHALQQDLNISEALSQLFQLHSLIHEHQCGTALLLELGQAIGLFNHEKKAIPDQIQTLAQARWDAKKARDFKTADSLRAEIESSGYLVEDSADGFRVRKK